ncbi:hypothetical protein LCGC14_1396890 [marine sediment metagenome]|uniref:Uncharacterized protein n=1 Tax=marine sediment metagenome TaxID=412755 RepID=A0A0F9MZX0_9ZZZZ
MKKFISSAIPIVGIVILILVDYRIGIGVVCLIWGHNMIYHWEGDGK